MKKALGIDKTLLIYVTLNILILTGEMVMDIGVQLLIVKASSFYQTHEQNRNATSNITDQDTSKQSDVQQNKLAASYLLYNRIILEGMAFILLPFYSIVLTKYGPKLPVTTECVFVIVGGVGYILCNINVDKMILDYVLVSTVLRSLSAMHGVFYIAASSAISYGYSGKDLSERHHWLFSARFMGSILGYVGQGTLQKFVGIMYVMLLSIFLFVFAVIIVLLFLSNTNAHVTKATHDDLEKDDTKKMNDDMKLNTGKDEKYDLTTNGKTSVTPKEIQVKHPSENSPLITNPSCSKLYMQHAIDNAKENISNFFSSLSAVFKKPASNMRRRIYIISILTILSVQLFDRMIKMARKDTVYLYLLMSSWHESEVSFLLAIEAVCSFLILTFGVPFITRILKFSDYTTCVLVLLLRAASFIWYSLRTSLFEVYVSTLLLMSLICLLLSALRSALSKLVPHENLVKMFSIMQLMDAAANILGTTLSLQLYKFTLETMPGTLFQVTAVMSFLMACAMGAVGCAQPKTQSQE